MSPLKLQEVHNVLFEPLPSTHFCWFVDCNSDTKQQKTDRTAGRHRGQMSHDPTAFGCSSFLVGAFH